MLDKLKAVSADCEVVLLTGKGMIETAVEAMKRGAHDYLTKPFPLAELEVVVQRAGAQRQLRKENQHLKAALERSWPNSEMIGGSPATQELFRLIERVGPTDKAILIEGESGTGKELVARALHRASPRAERPMVVINCAAPPESMLESELFGHEKGSFTGAAGVKPGLFEVADGGTLFIDEIGEMPGPLQAKLLRVLEDGSMRRIGSLKELRVDVRLLPPGVRARLTAADRAVTTGGAPARLETLIDEQLNLGRVGLYAKSLACMESLLLSRVLEHARGNQSLAARLLGVSRSSLRNKLHQLQIHIDPLTRIEDELVEDEAGQQDAVLRLRTGSH